MAYHSEFLLLNGTILDVTFGTGRGGQKGYTTLSISVLAVFTNKVETAMWVLDNTLEVARGLLICMSWLQLGVACDLTTSPHKSVVSFKQRYTRVFVLSMQRYQNTSSTSASNVRPHFVPAPLPRLHLFPLPLSLSSLLSLDLFTKLPHTTQGAHVPDPGLPRSASGCAGV